MNPWDAITPSEELEWHPCYDFVNPAFRCARLTVPLDYDCPRIPSRPSPKVHIAVTLLPAKNPAANRSPMLLNPGGPGGSGSMFALLVAPALQKILDPDQPIIGFDPRGIGFTTPVADCWATPPPCDGCPEDTAKGLVHRLAWTSTNAGFGFVNSSSIAFKYLEAGHRAVNDLCRGKDSQLEGQSIFAHASTAHVAQDMISIVDAWDRWVNKTQDAATLAVNPTQKKLIYWGFSYGTYLGATFASMFPDRVGRLILDGVVDAEHYVTPVWKESLVDTDKVLGEFFRLCVEAGPKCALYRAGDTQEDLGNRYHAILDRLSADPPITFTHPTSFFPVIVRASFIRALVFTVLYKPSSFPSLAILLDYIYQEKYEELAILFQDPQLLCLAPGNSLAGVVTDAQRAIMCSDKTKPVNLTLEEFRSEFDGTASISQFADIWVSLMLQCNGWDIYSPKHSVPKVPWTIPPNKTKGQQQAKIKTAFPILFLSNTYDPVTPLVAAVKMATKFQDAGLIEQVSSGHCTLASISWCTALAIKYYVLFGQVPPPPVVDGDDYLGGKWQRCWGNGGPWNEFDVAGIDGDDEEKRATVEMMEAFKKVRETLDSVPRFGVGALPGFEGVEEALRNFATAHAAV
ncbi:Alpha/Beta hydrolase protein [Podospora didyma]|uniref:Alpha/Beta hydrolase protein n=1 Tax=Podospora didyma TaxID=330526 RepID=A0AAE0P884_9PEZI|nr:Alpha/Beta hydrolase protein [Podospora didyma]